MPELEFILRLIKYTQKLKSKNTQGFTLTADLEKLRQGAL